MTKSNLDITGAYKRLREDLSSGAVSNEEAVCIAYASDNSRRQHVPDIVVWPATEAEVEAVVRIANATSVPVCVRGRGSATTGASLAEHGGIVLSTEKMDAVLAIDAVSRTATVQPGVLNGALAQALTEHGMFWPPDPSSSPYCSVGGNLATAAAGPRGVKYGGVRENVLALRAVCGNGQIISCGAPVPKSVAGYDLARLLVGSEGTLAIITAATLKLLPTPGASARTVASFPSSRAALAAVGRLMAGPITPAAVEFLDEGCLKLVSSDSNALGPAGVGAMLLLEVQASDAAAAARELDCVRELVTGPSDSSELLAFTTDAAADDLWEVRKVLSQRLRDIAGLKINEDIVVPVSRLAELIAFVQEACTKEGLLNVNFGHAGLGNIHLNLLFDDKSEAAVTAAYALVGRIMEYVVAMGGSISGEHGIGLAKREYLPIQVDAATLKLMRAVKDAFDPNGILNPGKLV